MTRLAFFALGAVALRLLEYILVIYAEQEPLLCECGNIPAEEHGYPWN
jgi:hypothetical protein